MRRGSSVNLQSFRGHDWCRLRGLHELSGSRERCRESGLGSVLEPSATRMTVSGSCRMSGRLLWSWWSGESSELFLDHGGDACRLWRARGAECQGLTPTAPTKRVVQPSVAFSLSNDCTTTPCRRCNHRCYWEALQQLPSRPRLSPPLGAVAQYRPCMPLLHVDAEMLLLLDEVVGPGGEGIG